MARETRYLYVGQSSDHELRIARIVDQIAVEGTLSVSDGSRVMDALNFVMSKDDCKFRVRYIHWRRDNPIAK